MSETVEPTLLHRLHNTPFRDLIRGRITGRLDYKATVEKAALSHEAGDLIRRVVRGTRLWPLEKVDVANELIAHFLDGVEAGATLEELIQSFGEERAAAKLIRRAKIRNRSLLWQVKRTITSILVCLVLIYSILMVRFVMSRPSPSVDYLGILNRAAVQTAPDQRAWPVYRKAVLACVLPPNSFRLSNALKFGPSSKYWAEAVVWIDEHSDAIELIRQGSERRAMGFIHGRNGSINDPELWPHPAPLGGFDPDWLMNAILPGHNDMRLLATVVAADAMLARERHEAARWLGDISALIKMAAQIHANDDVLFTGLVAIAVRSIALDEIDHTLSSAPSLLSESDLQKLAHLLATPNRADEMISLTGERMLYADTIQRVYTDDGRGDGHLTSAGIRLLESAFANSPQNPPKDRLIELLIAATAPAMSSRRDVLALGNHFLDIADANLHQPLREANWHAYQQEYLLWKASLIHNIRFIPVAMLVPSLERTHVTAELQLGHRDGVLAGLALEAYHRRHGNYPESLDSLTPDLLPTVPTDRITGSPVRYRLIGGKPIVYSVGVDHDDDGGKPPLDKNGTVDNLAAAFRWHDNPADGDWVLYPQPQNPPPDE